MNDYYFIYGRRHTYPYQQGYTMVRAKNLYDAVNLFRVVHPDENGELNCSEVCTLEEFQKIKSSKYLDLREIISLDIDYYLPGENANE